MTKQLINVGSSDLAGDGEGLRTAFIKINENFDEVYTQIDENTSTLSGLATVAYTGSFNDLSDKPPSSSFGSTPPDNPIEGDLWYNTAEEKLYIYYNNTWTDASPDTYELPTASTTVLGGVKVDGTTITIDNNGVISAFDPNLLGDLEIVDQTISGTNNNADIILEPLGTGGVSVPKLRIPVGTILGGTAPIVYTLTDVILDSILEYSTSEEDVLVIGDYGITNGIPAPYAVYQFTADPTPALQVNDILAGTGIPNAPDASVILAVGTGIYSNIVIAYSDYSTIPVPSPGTVIAVSRATTNANLFLDTEALTDISLNPGPGGNIVVRRNILPYNTDVYDLGSPAKRFRRVWLGPGTLYVQDETLGTDQAIGARDGNLYIDGGAGLTVGEFTFRDNNIFIQNNARDINIGTLGATADVVFNRSIKINDSTGREMFKTDRTGRTQFYPPSIPANDIGAVSIIGSANGAYQPVVNSGGMLHITGNNGAVSRITNDAFGTGSFPAYISRAGRGTAASPSAVQSGDILSRYSAVGWGTTNFAGATGPAPTNIEVYARENFTDTAGGTEYRFFTAPVGTSSKTLSLTVNETGISFANSPTQNTAAGIGITFKDSTRQTTAWTGSVAAEYVTGLSLVATTNNYSDLTGLPELFSGDYDDLTDKPNVITSIAVTSGLTVGRVNGSVTLGNSGVLSVAATSGTGQLGVNTVGGAVTLTMPQGLGTTSNVTFNNLTITGTLTVENFEVATEPTIEGKILYLASTAANDIDIDGGGIVLGPTDSTVNFRSFLYNLEFDRWDTDLAGLKTQDLFTDTIEVQGRGYFGNAYNDFDFPNAVIQIESDVDSYTQIVMKNHSDGVIASSDLVATNDIGDDESYYIDMGIVSSNYTDELWPILAANDGYVYVNGGNLRIGTDTATKDIKFFTGGTLATNIRATISDTGLTVVGTTSSTAFSGPLTGNVTGNVSGNAGTVTNGVYTTDTGTVTNTMLAGSIANNKLSNSSVTVNGTTISLGGSGTIAAAASTLTGTTLASNIVSSSLTSVGTLLNLTVTNPISGSVTGNAGTVTNGVYTTGTYNNPTWLIGLAYSKLTGTPTIPTTTNDLTNNSGFITTGSLSVNTNTPSGTTSTLSYNAGVFTFTSAAAYSLPTASTMVLGGVKIDGTTITINGSGVISAAVTGGTVTNVSALTIGTTGTDITSTVANSTSTPVITLNIPTASATNRGALSAADWTIFNNKGTVSSVSGTGSVSGLTLTGTVTGTGNLTLGGSLSLTSLQITTGLGYTPYNATNPAGYTSNTGTVTSVAALTIGTTGTDITSTVANGTTTPVITLNIPTASATNRGALSAADWTAFNSKGNGTVTSVVGAGTVNGLTLTGTVTGSGNLTLGGTLSGINNNQLTNSTISGVALGGSLSNVTFNNAGTGDVSGTTFNGSTARTISYNTIGAYAATNPAGYTSNVGTVTSIATSGSVNGITLTGGTITSSGTITLGGTLSGINNNQLTNSTISGVSLGGSLFNLTAGTGITFSSGTTYNGSAAITINATAAGVSSLAGGNNIILSGSTGAITINRIDGLQSVVTGNSGSTYNVLTTDQYIGTTRSATGTGTVTLPLGSTVPVGRQYVIKDEGGRSGSSSRRITVAASGSDTIDGSATRSITSNYGSLTVIWTGTIWSVI